MGGGGDFGYAAQDARTPFQFLIRLLAGPPSGGLDTAALGRSITTEMKGAPGRAATTPGTGPGQGIGATTGIPPTDYATALMRVVQSQPDLLGKLTSEAFTDPTTLRDVLLGQGGPNPSMQNVIFPDGHQEIINTNNQQAMTDASQRGGKLAGPVGQESQPMSAEKFEQEKTLRALGATRISNQMVLPKAQTQFTVDFENALVNKLAVPFIEAGQSAGALEAKLDVASGLLQDATAMGASFGQFGNLQTYLSNTGASLGIPPDTLKRLHLQANVGPVQALDSLVNQMALDFIGTNGMPKNNFSEADRNFVRAIVKGETDNPQAIAVKFEILRRVAEHNNQLTNDLISAVRPGDEAATDFRQWFSTTGSKPQNLFGDIAPVIEQTLGVKYTAPAAGSATAPGAAPAAAPPLPPNIPQDGAMWNPARRQFRDKNGVIYDETGKVITAKPTAGQ